MIIKADVLWSDGEKTNVTMSVESLSYSNNILNIYLFGDYDYYYQTNCSKYQYDSISGDLMRHGYTELFDKTLNEIPFEED